MSAVQVIQGEGFKLCITREDGYLHARVYDGTDSLQVSAAYWALLGQACREAGIDRLLVEEELHDSVDIAEIEQVIRVMVEAGMAGIRLAFVELLDDLPGNEYGEILCREHGIHARTFTDVALARNWLLYGE